MRLVLVAQGISRGFGYVGRPLTCVEVWAQIRWSKNFRRTVTSRLGWAVGGACVSLLLASCGNDDGSASAGAPGGARAVSGEADAMGGDNGRAHAGSSAQ